MHYFPERYINIELFRRFDYQILVPFLETFREYLERQPGFFWTKDCHEFPYLVMGRILHNYDNSAPISLFESFYHVQTLAQKCCRSELISIAQKENIKADFRHLPVHDLALLLLTQSPKSLEILHAKLFSDLNGRRLRRLDSFFIRDKRKTMNIPVQRPYQPEISQELRNHPLISSLSEHLNVYLLANPVMPSFIIHRFGMPLSGLPPYKGDHEYDFIYYNRISGELYLDVSEPALRQVYMEMFGKVYFNDPMYFDFEPAKKYTLEPLKEGILRMLNGVWQTSTVSKVDLLEIDYVMGGNPEHLDIPNGMITPRVRDELKEIATSSDVVITSAKPVVTLTNGHVRTLAIKTPNIFSYDVEGDYDHVRGWLEESHIIRNQKQVKMPPSINATPLASFLRLRESCLPVGAVKKQWELKFGDAYPAMKGFLQPGREFSPVYPCEDVPGGVMRVSEMPDGGLVAHAEDSPKMYTLTREDVRYYSLDMPRFRDAMADALGIQPNREYINTDDDVFRIGNYPIQPGVEIPVFGILAGNHSRFCKEGIKLLNRYLRQPFIIMTGTRDPWDVESRNRYAGQKVCLLTLAESLRINNGTLEAAPAWKDNMETYRKQLYPENLAVVPPYEFCKKGQIWRVRYDGEEIYVHDTDGPCYIALAVSKPKKPMYTLDAHQIVSKRDPAKTPQELMDLMTDHQTLGNLKRESCRLLAELEQARIEKDVVVEQEVLEQIDKMNQYLVETRGLGGRPRNFSSATDSIIRSVRQVIGRTIQAIGEASEKCANHLRKSITTNSVICYDPEVLIHWKL